MSFEIDYLLVTGNGFDLDLGIGSSYSQFVMSDSWRQMSKTRKKKFPPPSLIDFIEQKYKDNRKWFDLESAMLNFVLPNEHTSLVYNVEEDKKDYEAICTALVEHLCKCFYDPNPGEVASKMTKSYAGELLCDFFDTFMNIGRNIMYTFNYTPIEVIYGVVGGLPTTAEYYNIHGKISKNDFFNKNYDGSSIILGIMTKKEILPDYSFLIKSNHPKYNKNNIEDDLLSARNVIIFGHSLNKIDFGYFDKYFSMLASNDDKDRTLTIITKDESSRINILDNLRNMGIPVRDIFAHTNIQFVLTNSLYEKAEYSKFEKMIGSIK